TRTPPVRSSRAASRRRSGTFFPPAARSSSSWRERAAASGRLARDASAPRPALPPPAAFTPPGRSALLPPDRHSLPVARHGAAGSRKPHDLARRPWSSGGGVRGRLHRPLLLRPTHHPRPPLHDAT